MTRTFLERVLCMIAFITLFCTTMLAQDGPQRLEMGVYAGATLNTYTGKDIQNTEMKVGFNAGVIGSYSFYKNLFAELSLGVATKGYKQDTDTSSGQYWDDEGVNYDSELKKDMTTYNLDIPLYIGYRFYIGDNSCFSIKVGPYITYALSGQLKTSGYVITYPDIHSSEKEYINKEEKIGEIKDYNKFGAGIGCEINYFYNNFGISATFQRGLTKMYKKSDIFEQNISLSLNYSF